MISLGSGASLTDVYNTSYPFRTFILESQVSLIPTSRLAFYPFPISVIFSNILNIQTVTIALKLGDIQYLLHIYNIVF